MTDTVTHYTLEPGQSIASTYCTTLCDLDSEVIDHPGSFSARGTDYAATLTVCLYHGRDTEDEDMEDWGYDGPTFYCQSVFHNPNVLLLQNADPHSLVLAKRLGLEPHQDTIAIAYGRDGVLAVPRFKDDKPAFFGDFSINNR